MQIDQVYFSPSVKFFEKGFCKRWDVASYHDRNKPALFVGVYRPGDVKIINQHKGLKIIWHLGTVKDIFTGLNPKNLIVIVGRGIKFDIPARYSKKIIDIPIKDFIQLKDFTPYKPFPLGNKIYAYMGREKESSKKIMGYDTVKEIDRIIPFEIIYGYQGHSAEFIRDEYYKNSFVNIKPSITGGMTTAIEMAYMGRKTISNAIAPFCYKYNNLHDMYDIIMAESKKIGQMPQPLIDDSFFLNEWKNINYWS